MDLLKVGKLGDDAKVVSETVAKAVGDATDDLKDIAAGVEKTAADLLHDAALIIADAVTQVAQRVDRLDRAKVIVRIPEIKIEIEVDMPLYRAPEAADV